MMIAGLSISLILDSRKVAEEESTPTALPLPIVWPRILGAAPSA